MGKSLTIVDYGLGNLFSVARATAAVGGSPVITRDPEEIRKAERLILPGVGAFRDGMKGLRERGLDAAVKDFVKTGRPLLGLCLGMQLLLETSEEFGEHEGLGLVAGKVVRLSGRGVKIPHIGWNSLVPAKAPWTATALAALPAGVPVYFVHSYAAALADPREELAVCRYGGADFCAVLRKDNMTGCQFHPEKSGPAGLKILGNFLNEAAGVGLC